MCHQQGGDVMIIMESKGRDRNDTHTHTDYVM